MEKDCKTDGRNKKEDEERGVRLTEETTGYQAINHLRRETRKRAWGGGGLALARQAGRQNSLERWRAAFVRCDDGVFPSGGRCALTLLVRYYRAIRSTRYGNTLSLALAGRPTSAHFHAV